MLLSKLKVLPPKWAQDERIKLETMKDSLDQTKKELRLLNSWIDNCDIYQGIQELHDKISEKQFDLENKIREIIIHENINQRARFK